MMNEITVQFYWYLQMSSKFRYIKKN